VVSDKWLTTCSELSDRAALELDILIILKIMKCEFDLELGKEKDRRLLFRGEEATVVLVCGHHHQRLTKEASALER
jgi:hypothetical protein